MFGICAGDSDFVDSAVKALTLLEVKQTRSFNS